ncbi:hypothetical protein V6N11_051448 [Hibiscus sabdariffa]|uniref:Reverse transcriptase Ty1/copia-type domain-containing protein n=1 Tax=Hibiscus sabdariffa TaxID=183260 RepID=A0ABR2U728_9ROSI
MPQSYPPFQSSSSPQFSCYPGPLTLIHGPSITIVGCVDQQNAGNEISGGMSSRLQSIDNYGASVEGVGSQIAHNATEEQVVVASSSHTHTDAGMVNSYIPRHTPEGAILVTLQDPSNVELMSYSYGNEVSDDLEVVATTDVDLECGEDAFHGDAQLQKAMLVAKGYLQEEGIDFHEVFSPVVKLVTV